MTSWTTRRRDVCRLGAGLLVALLPFWAQAAEQATPKSASIDIVVADREAQPGDDVSIPVTLDTNGLEPSAIVMTVLFDSASLAFRDVENGPVAAAADKGISAIETSSGVLKIVVWGVNTTAMGDGELLELLFHVEDSASLGTLALTVPAATISCSDPDGIAVPVTPASGSITVTCTGPSAPSLAAGSYDAEQGVWVIWSEASGASAYQVYRADTDDETVSEAVSDWLPSTTRQYLDASLLANIDDYCRVYYWVRARNDDACRSAATGTGEIAVNDIPEAPTGLTASQGTHSDGVHLSWYGVENATEYRVYRSSSTDVAMRQPLSDWLPATYAYVDTTTAAAQYGLAAGCSGKQILDIYKYTYWIAARNAAGCESDPSDGVQGYRGVLDTSSASVLPAGAGDGLLWLVGGAVLAFGRTVRKRSSTRV